MTMMMMMRIIIIIITIIIPEPKLEHVAHYNAMR